MQLLTTLLSCLLSLFGSLAPASSTSITRIAGSDGDTLFSKTTLVDGVATFECFASSSGGCHYRVYEEACAAAPTAAPAAGAAAGWAQAVNWPNRASARIERAVRDMGMGAGVR